MKKYLILIALFTLLSQTIFAKQWIVVYGEKISWEAVVGHTFASFIQEDIFQKQTKLVGCWGFYPQKKDPKGIFGTIPAELKDDWKTHKDYAFLVEVSTEEFNQCLKIKDLYLTKLGYSLNGKSCVNFIRDIISAIPRLKQPNKIYVFPDEMVLELKLENKLIEQESIKGFNNSIGNVTNMPQSTENQSRPDFNVALNFINSYVKYILSRDKKQPSLKVWIKNNVLLSPAFKAKYKPDPDADLILAAQDFPEKGFVISKTDPSQGYVIMSGVGWTSFKVIMKVVLFNNKWLVDGTGWVNIPADKQLPLP